MYDRGYCARVAGNRARVAGDRARVAGDRARVAGDHTCIVYYRARLPQMESRPRRP